MEFQDQLPSGGGFRLSQREHAKVAMIAEGIVQAAVLRARARRPDLQ